MQQRTNWLEVYKCVGFSPANLRSVSAKHFAARFAWSMKWEWLCKILFLNAN